MKAPCRTIWIPFAQFLSILVLGTAACTQTAEDPTQALIDNTVHAMGGQDNLAQVRYLRFDFVVEIGGQEVLRSKHLWDRQNGRYRVDWEGFGQNAQALFNVNTREGRAFASGEPVGAEEQQEVLDQAYQFFLNDSYWLLMPWKMNDPGVTPTYVGEEEIDGEVYDIVLLQFQDAGMTPGDQHWVFISRETGLVERSAYFLERFEDGIPSMEEATIWDWLDWEDVGPVRFAVDRQFVRTTHDPFESAHIFFPLVVVLDEVDDEVFASPSHPLPGS